MHFSICSREYCTSVRCSWVGVQKLLPAWILEILFTLLRLEEVAHTICTIEELTVGSGL